VGGVKHSEVGCASIESEDGIVYTKIMQYDMTTSPVIVGVDLCRTIQAIPLR
jgi:hypothetical protein